MDYKELMERLKDSELPSSEEAARAIEPLLAERDTAINLLRGINWCCGCVHFKGLEGCGVGIMEECNKENDHYQFCGPRKENKED